MDKENTSADPAREAVRKELMKTFCSDDTERVLRVVRSLCEQMVAEAFTAEDRPDLCEVIQISTLLYSIPTEDMRAGRRDIREVVAMCAADLAQELRQQGADCMTAPRVEVTVKDHVVGVSASLYAIKKEQKDDSD